MNSQICTCQIFRYLSTSVEAAALSLLSHYDDIRLAIKTKTHFCSSSLHADSDEFTGLPVISIDIWLIHLFKPDILKSMEFTFKLILLILNKLFTRYNFEQFSTNWTIVNNIPCLNCWTLNYYHTIDTFLVNVMARYIAHLYNCLHSIFQQHVDERFTEHFFDIKQQYYEFPQHRY